LNAEAQALASQVRQDAETSDDEKREGVASSRNSWRDEKVKKTLSEPFKKWYLN